MKKSNTTLIRHESLAGIWTEACTKQETLDKGKVIQLQTERNVHGICKEVKINGEIFDKVKATLMLNQGLTADREQFQTIIAQKAAGAKNKKATENLQNSPPSERFTALKEQLAAKIKESEVIREQELTRESFLKERKLLSKTKHSKDLIEKIETGISCAPELPPTGKLKQVKIDIPETLHYFQVIMVIPEYVEILLCNYFQGNVTEDKDLIGSISEFNCI